MRPLLLLALAAAAPHADPPLPEGAVAPLGSPAWRNAADTRSSLAFSPGGRGGAKEQSYCYPIGIVPEQSQLVVRVFRTPDTLIRVLDIPRKKVVSEWKLPASGQPGMLTSASLSPDGRLLWASGDKVVRLWD